MVTNSESTKLVHYPAAEAKRIVKADLHNHLRTSSRMKGKFNPAIDKAQRVLGSGGLFALVNFDDQRYEDLANEPGYERQDLGCALYVPQKDILVVKGQEVPTRDGHLLVLGIKKDTHLASNRSLASTILEAKSHGGIVIADHPFYKEGIGPYIADHIDVLLAIDAIEGHNGCASLWLPGLTPDNANKEAQLVYNFVHQSYPDLGFVSVSDGHSIWEIGKSYTNIEMPQYSEFINCKDVKQNLGKAVRKSKPENCVINPARLGCFMHLAALAYYEMKRRTNISTYNTHL